MLKVKTGSLARGIGTLNGIVLSRPCELAAFSVIALREDITCEDDGGVEGVSSSSDDDGDESVEQASEMRQGMRETVYKVDHEEAVRTAQSHGWRPFPVLLGQNKGEHHEPIDDEAAQDAHRQLISRVRLPKLVKSLFEPRRAQALKKFTSGGGGGGGSQTQLISMAMAEASKLFDQSGGASSGGKQDAVNGAALTVTKLLAQSKLSSLIGGGNSGGLSGLAGLASKFM
ncbi:hypothetical protein BJV74DRAFT_950139 [Russula compacta]|nr:hypothetical protein BJV74DRAFT_950139 [Russula compacta]